MDQACGLDGNSIYGITTDREGKLWILTRQTVTIFTPGEQTFSTLRASSPHINMENFLCMYKDSNDLANGEIIVIFRNISKMRTP